MTAMTAPASMTSPAQLCTFRADGLLFGVAVANVQEVLRYQHMSAVPRAPGSVSGLINLRGQIVTAIDLRHRLGLTPRAEDELPMNVVIRSRGEVVSLLVDDIGDVIDTEDMPMHVPPPNLAAGVSQALDGVLMLPDSILLVLDADRAADLVAVA